MQNVFWRLQLQPRQPHYFIPLGMGLYFRWSFCKIRLFMHQKILWLRGRKNRRGGNSRMLSNYVFRTAGRDRQPTKVRTPTQLGQVYVGKTCHVCCCRLLRDYSCLECTSQFTLVHNLMCTTDTRRRAPDLLLWITKWYYPLDFNEWRQRRERRIRQILQRYGDGKERWHRGRE